MRVFVSSTVYDLIDVRAEISALLNLMGISPVLSDDKLSDFHVQQSANSIETCLVNVAASDEVIVILDKRYGPRLGDYGFENISATHLEYQHAVKEKNPIHMYVRDRLEADFGIWKRNKRKDSVELTWVKKPDYGLFDVLDEHSRLSAKAKQSNWYRTFTSTVDLKASLRKYFDKRVLPERVIDAISRNAFPLFDLKVQATNSVVDFCQVLHVKARVTNVGGSPAFDVAFYWSEDMNSADKKSRRNIIAPRAFVKMSFMYGVGEGALGIKKKLIVEYSSPLGVGVVDTFEVGSHIRPGPQPVMFSGGKLLTREFRQVPDLQLTIQDSDS
jgi:hypothetical protein